MSGKLFIASGFFLLLWLLSPFVAAQVQMQDMQRLQVEANEWIRQQLDGQPGRHEVDFAAQDPRLRLPACQSPLAIEPHANAELRGRVNLRVTCLDRDWFIYLAADIRRLVPVVVARNAIPRGTGLTPNLLALQEMDVSRLRGNYYTAIQDVTGMRLRNRLRPGDAVTNVNLMASDAVNRGDQVMILAVSGTGALGVRMAGEALDNGKVGDQVRVKNLQSGRVIRALVVGRGQVEVRF